MKSAHANSKRLRETEAVGGNGATTYITLGHSTEPSLALL